MTKRYAVLWAEGDGPAIAGSLALRANELVLDGVPARGLRTLRRVPYADVTSIRVGRHLSERLDRRPTVIVGSDRRPELRLVSLEGPGMTGELEEHLAAACRRPALAS